MSNVSSISTTSAYGYTAPTKDAVSAALAQSAATQLSVINTLTSLGSNSSAPLTYDVTGLLSSFAQTTPAAAGNSTSSTQAAQDAYLQVQYAISQTLASIVSGSSTDSSNQDIFSLVNPAGAYGASGLPGSSSSNLLFGATSTTSAQAAQYAALNAQYAISQALNSMTAGSSTKASSGA